MFSYLILLALSIWAYKSIPVFALQNGLFEYFDSVRQTTVFPNGDPLIPYLTDIAYLDERVKNVIIFTWPFVTGNRPDLSLVELGFSGAFGSGWFLIVLESFRIGSRGTWASRLLLPGILIFEHSHALMTPLYLIFHLSTSPITSIPTGDLIRVSSIDGQAIVGSFVLGFLLPMAIFALPSPAIIDIRLKQTVIGWYQQWHIYIYAFHVIIALIITLFTHEGGRGTGLQIRSDHQSMYAFALLLAAVPYWTVVLSLLLSTLFPTSFPVKMKLKNVFGLVWPRSGLRSPSLDESLKWLLQWDFVISSLTMLCWAASIFVQAQWALGQETEFLSLIFKIVVSSVLVSPTGAAVQLMWERDEMVFNYEALV